MIKIKVPQFLRDLLCKLKLHRWETERCESGIRVIKEFCKCKNCKKEKMFVYENDF